MYHTIVRRLARRNFKNVSEGNFEAALSNVAEDVHHVFPGENAIGGERHSREAMRRWFQRLYRLFPGLDIEVKRVASRGWPWDTVVAVEWIDRAQPRDGMPYENEGAHFIRIRWGRAVYIHAYLDTERVNETLDRLAAKGVAEAAAEPIVG
jgi:ketosteroid isomerase-like protein